MSPDDALKILKADVPASHKPRGDDKNRILLGMQLLSQKGADTDLDMAAEHDQIWFGAFNLVEKMTEDEVLTMHAWGWFEAEDSWSHFT